MLNEYLGPVLGAGEGFADEAQANEVMGLVMRHWNTVGHELEQSLKKKDIHAPLLNEVADMAEPLPDDAYLSYNVAT